MDELWAFYQVDGIIWENICKVPNTESGTQEAWKASQVAQW